MDKMREEFEEWFLNEYCHGCGPVNYGAGVSMAAWKSWQASRASLCVQMPRCCNEEQDSYRLNMMDSLDDAGVRYE